MIFISSQVADVNGVVKLELDRAKSDLETAERRVSTTKTLDGGVAIIDSGFADGDRRLKIVARNVGAVQAAALKSLQRNNAILNLSMFDGVYLVALKSLSIKNGGASLTVYIKSKIS